ncbi:MAG: response regulator transcription factor [Acaryochloris sp. RU_4_1]|nr:response regulator transcription factor [Acaryochloris sp. RU_4_1]NJR57032.1 response regulator transcription factor [Acaryochloris sp. CRU_2_0]
MKILIVEDNADLRLNINTALSRAGYVVDAADTYTTAEWLILQQEYDLLILDWMLPEGSGLELCQLYRQMGKRSPVIMLTARDRSADKVMGLDSGADDYVVKPVDIPELLARVRAMGRRSLSWQGECLRLGDLHLHLDRLVIAFGDHQTTLCLTPINGVAGTWRSGLHYRWGVFWWCLPLFSMGWGYGIGS